ncbi:MAG TPA: HD domain-containing phosphohydrolase [Gaiellaceae bacterium]|nr:HD domain-containing phosphohydrolase [Gaiellaceae bacterium]
MELRASPYRRRLPLALGFVSLAVLAYAGVRGLDALPVLAAAAASLAALAALARGARGDGANGRERDPVTGLRTRACLVAELERRLRRPDPPPTLVLVFDLHGFQAYNEDYGREAGDALLARLAERLRAALGAEGEAFRLPGDELALLATVGEGDAERLIDAAADALSTRGEGFRVECSFGGVLVPYETADAQEALRLAEERLAGHRRSKQGIRTVNALVGALSGRKAAPLEGRVESLAVAVGGLLGVHGDRLEALARAAELHDVGTLSIPSDILGKPGPLDEDEWEFVRRQTLVGERILRTSPQLREVAAIVRTACENWDGSGYPDGLSGEEIPLAARIIRVCHAFDAMLSPRSYRPALTPEEALAELESRAGTIFDPVVVRVLGSLVRARSEGERAA